MNTRMYDQLSCVSRGGGFVGAKPDPSDYEWAYGRARCQGREVIYLSRKVANEWRIVDSLLLPPVAVEEPYAKPRNAKTLWLFGSEECHLNNDTPANLFVAVRWTPSARIDSRSGVAQAWSFDVERQRIVSVPASEVVCDSPQPEN